MLDDDIYTRAVAKAFDIPVEQVSLGMRIQAKVACFHIIYQASIPPKTEDQIFDQMVATLRLMRGGVRKQPAAQTCDIYVKTSATEPNTRVPGIRRCCKAKTRVIKHFVVAKRHRGYTSFSIHGVCQYCYRNFNKRSRLNWTEVADYSFWR